MNLMTIGDIARKNGVPFHRAKYAAELARVEPTARVGVTRLFNHRAAVAIQRRLKTSSAK